MDDPIFTYGVLKDIALSEINFEKVIFLGNPSITYKRILILFFVYGPYHFFKFIFAYLWWNVIRRGRVRSLFESQGVECLYFDKSEIDEVVKLVGQLTPNLILSINCNMLLPQLVLNKATLGGINLHQGSLPEYKGLMPIFYSQLNGESVVGSSIHKMNSSFDSGEILIQEKITIQPGENYVKIWKKLNQVGARNILKLLRIIIIEGSLPLTRTQIDSGSYYSLPSISLALKYYLTQRKKLNGIFRG